MNNDTENKIVYLRLDDILPNRFQPREVFDEEGLEELADSIKEHGVIQPIIVRQVGNKYELIAGERRSKASALAGLTTIPAIIKNMDDKESAKVSLLENLQRKNLSAIEEARTYKRILELDNMTQEDLAKTMGKSQPMVANKLRLLALPEEVQDALIKNQISERHARSLLNIKDKPTQLMLLDRIKKERLTVRELDAEIKKNLNPNENGTNEDNSSDNNSIPAYNNFNLNNNPNISTYDNFNNGFNNMGLDDYKTSLGNNITNNSFTNMNQFSNMPENNFSQLQNNNFSNMSYEENTKLMNNDSSTTNIYEQDYNNSNNDFSFINSNNTNTNNTNNTDSGNNFSLGSMFDGNPNNVNNNYSPENINYNNPLVSNIRESDIKTQENKFLPNFDDKNIENNFSSPSDNASINEFNSNFSNEMNEKNNYSNNQFDKFTDFQSLNSPINDYNINDNQGNLFNQPLNIVDVSQNNINNYNEDPSNNLNDYSLNENNKDFAFDNENKVNDNPFDDAYENILFAKPVPVEPLNSEENTISSSDDSENNMNISDESVLPKNEYISLEHERTLFTTRDAVLELKKTTDRIKQDGINLDSEEIDFDDYYQIIIKIKK